MNQEEFCRVLYDFKADGNNELSVTKGEVVKLISAHGEWMMVEKVIKPFLKGFVPTLYITIIKNSSLENSKTSSLSSSMSQEPPREEKRKTKQIANSSSVISSIPANKSEKNDNQKIQSSPSKPNGINQQSTIQKPFQPTPIIAQSTPQPLNSQPITPIQETVKNSSTHTEQEKVIPLTKPSVDTRKSLSTQAKNTQKGIIQKPLLSGFVTKVVADYEESITLIQSYETNEKVFKQTLVQREEAFKSVEQKLDKISKDVLDFQTTNDQLIDKIRRLELRIENDRSNLINNYSTDVSGIKLPEATERKRNTNRSFQSASKN